MASSQERGVRPIRQPPKCPPATVLGEHRDHCFPGSETLESRQFLVLARPQRERRAASRFDLDRVSTGDRDVVERARSCESSFAVGEVPVRWILEFLVPQAADVQSAHQLRAQFLLDRLAHGIVWETRYVLALVPTVTTGHEIRTFPCAGPTRITPDSAPPGGIRPSNPLVSCRVSDTETSLPADVVTFSRARSSTTVTWPVFWSV